MRNFMIICLGAAVLATGCGSSGDSPLPTADIIFDADGANSGYSIDGAAPLAGSFVAVGDSAGDTVARGFYRFDISTLPAGAVVQGATLRTGLNLLAGDPFLEFGSCVVDHVAMGAEFDGADFGAAPLSAVIGSLATNATIEQKTMDVTAAVQADVAAARTTSDYRLYFVGAPDGEADNDFVHFTNNGVPGVVGVEPSLLVTYSVP